MNTLYEEYLGNDLFNYTVSPKLVHCSEAFENWDILLAVNNLILELDCPDVVAVTNGTEELFGLISSDINRGGSWPIPSKAIKITSTGKNFFDSLFICVDIFSELNFMSTGKGRKLIKEEYEGVEEAIYSWFLKD